METHAELTTIIDKPRIFLSGTFGAQNFEYCWLQWLQEHGYAVQAFEPRRAIQRYVRSHAAQRILRRGWFRGFAWLVSGQLVRAACAYQPDLVLVVSGNYLTSAALKAIRQKTRATLFHFYGEDFFNPLNTTPVLRQAAPVYDHWFTTKSFNVSEMAAIGLTQVSYVPHGYRPNCHYRVAVNEADRKVYGADVSFVGTWEGERASVLHELQGVDLKIWGNDWANLPKNSWLRPRLQGRAVYCEEMSRVFNASKINLAFLRKANRDRHTSRTFEIPACGGFQLSERTDEILGFFEEGKEIACFDSVEELKDKVKYYTRHDAQRNQVALAGYDRVYKSPYSYHDRLATMLMFLTSTNNHQKEIG